MADVEQRAEAEASAKGLSGQARKSYIGGVFNKIRQAHARVVKPGKGKTFMSNLNRRNRQLARARYQEALRPHEEAVTALKQQRKHELAQLSPEKQAKPGVQPFKQSSDPITRLREHEEGLKASLSRGRADQAAGRDTVAARNIGAYERELELTRQQLNRTKDHAIGGRIVRQPPKREPAERQRQRAIAAHQDEPRESSAQLTQRILHSDLKPVRHVEGLNIGAEMAAGPNPTHLRDIYGQEQLPKALDLFPTPSLRKAARERGVPAGGSRHDVIARLAQPTTPPKHRPASDVTFADAVRRAVAKRENGSSFATFPEVREELRRETGLSDAMIDDRLRKLREEGDAGRAPLTLHFEQDEDRMHIPQRGQLRYRDQDFDFIGVLPSVSEQKRIDADDMQRIERERGEMFRAHGLKPPKLPAPERQRQRAIADAIQHGAPDFPPGTLAAAQGKPVEVPIGQPVTPIRRDLPLKKSDPYATPDPHDIIRGYGEHQLGAFISQFSAETLRDMARKQGIQHPGRSRPELVRAIVHHVTQGRYGGATSAQGKPAPTGVRLSVRPYTYHGNAGYLISGSDKLGRRISIFAKSKSEAERMRDDIKAGRETMFDSER